MEEREAVRTYLRNFALGCQLAGEVGVSKAILILQIFLSRRPCETSTAAYPYSYSSLGIFAFTARLFGLFLG